MTESNQKLRDKLQSIERIVTTALASQPHGDEECGEHLRKSLSDISNAIGEESGGNSAVLRDAMVQLLGELAFCEKNVERECGLSAFGLGQHCKIVRGIIDSALSAPNEHRGNAAAMREALVSFMQLADYGVIQPRSVGEDAEYCFCVLKKMVRAALSAPARNCDRPECATSKAAQDVWRKEDGGKTPYYEWLFAPAAERKGESDGR